MIEATFLICGVRAASAVTYTITLSGKLAPPVKLYIHSRGGGNAPVTIAGSTYQGKLVEGDHIFQVTAPLDGSDPGQGATLSFGGDVTFVEPPPVDVVAWKGPVVDTGNDPKDPWPPPRVLVKLGDSTWLVSEFARLVPTIVSPRSGPKPDKPLPR